MTYRSSDETPPVPTKTAWWARLYARSPAWVLWTGGILMGIFGPLTAIGVHAKHGTTVLLVLSGISLIVGIFSVAVAATEYKWSSWMDLYPTNGGQIGITGVVLSMVTLWVGMIVYLVTGVM